VQVIYTTTAGGAGRRRLQASTDGLVTYIFKASFPGSEEPVTNAMTIIQKNPCTVEAWCAQLQSITALHESGQIITDASLDLSLLSYQPGSLKFSTSYQENGGFVGSAAVLLASNQDECNRGRLISCTTTLSEGTRLWECVCYIAAGEKIRLAAAAHNTKDPNDPLTAIIEVTAPGLS
jgi:hypothetical protein